MTDVLKIFDVVKFIYERINGWEKLKQEKIERIFETVAQDSFNELETIHKDYTIKLSMLRQHLISRTLPPKELIFWLRNAGLEYRANRDLLPTITEDIKRFSAQSTDPNKDRESKFYFYLRKYVRSVLNYYAVTSYNDLSFYRGYESQLNTLLLQMERLGENDKRIAELFYSTDNVEDMNEQLIRICDKVLPERWQDVGRNYRSLRAIVQSSE
jgi:hypothetical protein